MSRTANFAKHLSNFLNGKKTGLTWRTGVPVGSNRECVDVEGWVPGEKEKRRVLVEIELRRIAPVANVAKVWRWLGKGKLPPREDYVFVQAFSKFYGREPGFLRDNARYLGRQLADRFDNVSYVPMNFDYNPYKKRQNVTVAQGGGAMREAAQRLAGKIARKLGRLETN